MLKVSEILPMSRFKIFSEYHIGQHMNPSNLFIYQYVGDVFQKRVPFYIIKGDPVFFLTLRRPSISISIKSSSVPSYLLWKITFQPFDRILQESFL